MQRTANAVVPQMQVTRNGNDLWLSFWVSNLDSPHHHHQPHQQLLSSWGTSRHCPEAVAGTWPQPSSNLSSLSCLSSWPAATAYSSFGGMTQCQPQINSVSPTSDTQASFLPQTTSSALSAASVIASIRHHVWDLLSRKQPVLDTDTKFYLSVLLCSAAANSVFTFVRAFSFAYGGLVAARKLHEQLLTSVINAPAKFFQTTLPGKCKHDCQCRFSLCKLRARRASLPLLISMFSRFGCCGCAQQCTTLL